jgi:hypothetical protein
MRRGISISLRIVRGERRRTDLISGSEQRLLLAPRQDRLGGRPIVCLSLICILGKIEKLGQKLFFSLLLSHLGTYSCFYISRTYAVALSNTALPAAAWYFPFHRRSFFARRAKTNNKKKLKYRRV